MRVVKPQHLSVLHRCFERQQHAYLGIAVLAYVPLQNEPALLPEQELWQEVPPLLDPQIPLDMALPKTGGEFLLMGEACAPRGERVGGLDVEARVGGLRKALRVFGPRYWVAGRATEPVPVDAVPLTWAQAYGGTDFAENPAGKGRAPEETSHGRLQPLAQVEYPNAPSTLPTEVIAPASFAPIPGAWPQRKRFDGSYDDAWLKQHYPGPPEDFNWRFHGLASEDQWQSEPFQGDEAIELRHLHPEQPHIECRLPGIRPVIAVRTRAHGPGQARFVDGRLTTLWLFPRQLRMVMIWHALLEVDNEFADEVELLMAGAEWIARPRAREAYVQAIDARLHPDSGGLKALDDHELLPEGLATPNEMMLRHKRLLGASGGSLEQLNQRLRAAQQELDDRLGAVTPPGLLAEAKAGAARARQELGVPEVPTQVPDEPAQLAAAMQQIEAQLLPPAQLKAALEARGQAALQATRQELTAQGKSVAALDALARPKPSLAAFSPTQAVAQLEQVLAQSQQALEPRLKSLAAHAEKTAGPMLREAAHLQPAPVPLDPETAGRWREGAARAQAQGRSFAGLKLKGADFSGLDLSHADFSGAELEGVNFSGATLTGANFSHASLAHAILDDAKLEGANFTQANLGKARLARASCVGCEFKGATLQHTVLDQAVLYGSRLAGVTLLEISAAKSHWIQVDLTQAVILKSVLNGAVFTKATLTRASFIEAQLRECDFSGARLDSADFVTCPVDGSRFDGCQANNVRFVHGSSLRRTSFKDAQVEKASLRGMPLDGADFSNALLAGSDLSEAGCAGVNFYRCNLKAALLIKGNFQSAVLRGANLMQAVLQHARLQGADLQGANLFAADLMRIDVDAYTRFDAAVLTKARLHPQRKAGRAGPETTGGGS
ncbi:pentapeptide repeat-containing protein [Aquabacterium sp. A7-Y]|uniref:DUF2169 family type VI secretion system accessory protein n=1 Tax=Aquabacterium sp. A7-Y TaxID=1349605 RepID=UPI00223E4433|nr:DUF2169 domain-containing protein [Aquabacterium sp. A7-Y]MCW7540757.1 pentapeptide repeat-containing protein [Aquabacterium sp. A7-Y]